jgi:hypothetical protein
MLFCGVIMASLGAVVLVRRELLLLLDGVPCVIKLLFKVLVLVVVDVVMLVVVGVDVAPAVGFVVRHCGVGLVSGILQAARARKVGCEPCILVKLAAICREWHSRSVRSYSPETIGLAPNNPPTSGMQCNTPTRYHVCQAF